MVDVKIKVEPGTAEAVVSRALFLAYQASSVVGMGVFQAQNNITEQQFWDATEKQRKWNDNKVSEAYVDYGFGRMMKVGFNYSDDGEIEVREAAPRIDYQSWAGKYKSYEDLILAALHQLNMEFAAV